MSDVSECKVAVVTGASSGIGKATAVALARLGWHVIGTGRDPRRSAEAEAVLRAAAAEGNGKAEFLTGDFCELDDVMRIGGEIKRRTSRLDVLINNAGGVRDQRYVSSQGLEATMAGNHFGPFLLTRELMRLLEATVPLAGAGNVRILAVSSLAHERCKEMRWGDLNWENDFAATPVYGQAKLANMLFTRELNRRFAGEGIVAHAMHPGIVATNFTSHGDENLQRYLKDMPSHPPEHSAETLVWMATASETGLPGGRYFYDHQEAQAAPQALDDQAAARLWSETEEILQKAGY